MRTMQDVFEEMEGQPLFEAADEEALAVILEGEDDLLEAIFEEADADRLEFLAALLDAAAAGSLTEQQQLALEGLRSWIKSKAAAVKKKLPPGTKMVFGKIVKVGKGAVGAAKAVGRTAVAAKRGVQAHSFRFTAAGKQARAAAKKVRDVKGRAAGKASYSAAKKTYQAASRAGESHAFAAGQASRAQDRTGKGARAATYGPSGAAKAPAKKRAPKGKGKGVARARKESMDDVFLALEERA